jgi:trk system potassium uptake protein TrkA
MFNEMWGVDVSVSTPHLLTAMVEEAVSVGSLVRIMKFEHGKAQLAEVTLAEGSPAVGRRIADLGLPRETTIVAIMRDGHVVAPQGDTPLHQGDEVVVLMTGDCEDAIQRILIGASA